jgi:hypothetical protein
MIPIKVWHDQGPKTILGTKIPAGQAPEQDIKSVISILANHHNTGPFISRRLIQALVTSDPSPQYIQRISALYESDETGKRGNIAAMVAGILSDPEARAGDDERVADFSIGRIKEPVLAATSVMRALGCKKALYRPNGYRVYGSSTTILFAPKTVFGFTSPDHKAPGSGLNSPEQRLINSIEIGESRLGSAGIMGWYDFVSRSDSAFRDAACNLNEYSNTLDQSEEKYLDLVKLRFYRGSVPSATEGALRKAISLVNSRKNGADQTYKDPSLRALYIIALISASSSFGVVR